MLCLSRKSGESIVLPNQDITITIQKISGNRVCISFDAPREVAIRRSELLPHCAQATESVDTDELYRMMGTE
ncbi:carbon storage regulator [Novipirellula artificiosorum]|uniref:Translational regulator CsrA n=1 Tax=Novipirellula artificiosorum TaxID=2528016 RepID=A0A5C6DTA9_9BACT|nr:carbon storage regulator [Novipirellula artificiosorum]TWU39424.1 hypothetical protein Poly41_22480 [Novipirellula artificiosorum]